MINRSAERRVNPRIEINGPMTYQTGDSDKAHRGKLENLSVRGARIWIDEELPAASQLLFQVEANDREEVTMEFTATLLHMLPDRKKSLYGYGCSIEQGTVDLKAYRSN